MSKIIILGDIHIGARNASPIVCEHHIKFFENELFPYLKANNIDIILQLGDCFDTRKFSSHTILHQWKSRVFDYLENNNIKFITILGNHDIAYRSTTEVNSTSLLLKSYKNVTIIDTSTEYMFDQTKFLLIPWICDSNKNLIETAIKNTDALYLGAHLELAGFEMSKGVKSYTEDDSIEEYSKFDTVFTGHYHTRSIKDNIHYVGTPYEITWVDYDDAKGFHTFDTATHKVEFIKSKCELFHRISYDDSFDSDHPAYLNLDDTYVKVVVITKNDPYKFEKFINSILIQNPADLKIIEVEEDFNHVDIDNIDLKMDSTETTISKFVDNLETDLDKETIKKMMQLLFVKALEVTD